MKMKYVLENPSFTNRPIEIDNPKAVKQIAAYVNKPIILGDEIFIVSQGILTKLQLIEKDTNEAKFKKVKSRRCNQ